MINLDNVFDIDAIGLILMAAYSCFFLFIVFLLLKKEKLNSPNILLLSMASFLMPISLFLLNQIFHFKSTPPDSLVYASIITDFTNYFDAYSFGVKGFSALNFVPYKLCFNRPFVYVIFNVFYYQIAILFLFKAFMGYIAYYGKEVNRRKFYSLLLLLATFYPVSLLLNASILRESMALMFSAIFCYFLVKYVTKEKRARLHIAIFFLALIFLTRPLSGVCCAIAVFAAISYKKKLLSIRNFLKLIVVIAVVVFSIKALVSNLYQLDFSLDWLVSYRDKSNSKFGTEGYSSLDWSSPFSFLTNVSLLISQYLLSPLPILVSKTVTFNKIIPLIDAIYIICVLLAPVLLFFKKFMKGWILLFLIFLVLPALFETNISGAYRHRMNAVFLLIPLVSYFGVNLKLK